LLCPDEEIRSTVGRENSSVEEYLTEKGNLSNICKKCEISSDRQLGNWIKVHNGHKEFRETHGTGGGFI